MSKEVTVTFQGELGIELHVDRASGTVRIKRAEADSPAKPHEGAALRSINGKPVGKIVDKAAWLALVERLRCGAAARAGTRAPEDPVQRARAELDAPRRQGRGRGRGRRERAGADGGWPSAAAGRGAGAEPELTCKHCGRDAIDGFFSALVGSPFAAKPAGPRV